MQQIVDLENDPAFQAQHTALLSIAIDPINELATGAKEAGITKTPMLSDSDSSVSALYDVLKWALPSGEPGHTFILVDEEGRVAWIQDYGAPNNPNRTMYVPIPELVAAIENHLK